MARTLIELCREIMGGNPTINEWILLSREVDEAIASASEKEVQAFADSGAGELLDMICSGHRKEKE